MQVSSVSLSQVAYPQGNQTTAPRQSAEETSETPAQKAGEANSGQDSVTLSPAANRTTGPSQSAEEASETAAQKAAEAGAGQDNGAQNSGANHLDIRV